MTIKDIVLTMTAMAATVAGVVYWGSVGILTLGGLR